MACHYDSATIIVCSDIASKSNSLTSGQTVTLPENIVVSIGFHLFITILKSEQRVLAMLDPKDIEIILTMLRKWSIRLEWYKLFDKLITPNGKLVYDFFIGFNCTSNDPMLAKTLDSIHRGDFYYLKHHPRSEFIRTLF